jgi:hypothetical protein
MEGEADMNDQILKSYLEGNVTNKDRVRHTLAAEGPQIILPTLRMTLPILRTMGEQLAIIFIKPSGRNYDIEMEVEPPIDDLYVRVQHLVHDIACLSSQYAKMVGEQMLIALADRDKNLRALATLHSIDSSIPSAIVSGSLTHLLFHADDLLTRDGVAVALLRIDMPVDEIALSEAAKQVGGLLGDLIFKNFPALVDRIRFHFRDQGENYQNVMIAIFGVYYSIALRGFDGASGGRISASLVH